MLCERLADPEELPQDCEKNIISLAVITLLSLLPLHSSLADTAQVMPKGLHRVEFQNKFKVQASIFIGLDSAFLPYFSFC